MKEKTDMVLLISQPVCRICLLVGIQAVTSTGQKLQSNTGAKVIPLQKHTYTQTYIYMCVYVCFVLAVLQ